MADMSIICRRKNINAKMLFSNYIWRNHNCQALKKDVQWQYLI
jgi:hypothetical protein